MSTFRLIVAIGLACASLAANADVIPHGAVFETCRDEGAECKLEERFKGKCMWLTHAERSRLAVRSYKAICEKEGPNGGKCLTCVSEAYRASGPAKKNAPTPDPAKPVKQP